MKPSVIRDTCYPQSDMCRMSPVRPHISRSNTIRSPRESSYSIDKQGTPLYRSYGWLDRVKNPGQPRSKFLVPYLDLTSGGFVIWSSEHEHLSPNDMILKITVLTICWNSIYLFAFLRSGCVRLILSPCAGLTGLVMPLEMIMWAGTSA